MDKVYVAFQRDRRNPIHPRTLTMGVFEKKKNATTCITLWKYDNPAEVKLWDFFIQVFPIRDKEIEGRAIIPKKSDHRKQRGRTAPN